MLDQTQKFLNSSPYACIWHRAVLNEDGTPSYFMTEGVNLSFLDQFESLRINDERIVPGKSENGFSWFSYFRKLWETKQKTTVEDYFPSVKRHLKIDSSYLDDQLIVSWIKIAGPKSLKKNNQEEISLFSLLLEKIDGIAVQGYDANRKVKFWNKASEEMYGYSAHEAFGQDLVDLIIPEDMREEVITNIDSMLKASEARLPEFLQLRKKDGDLLPVMSHHTVLEYPKGEFLLFCIDVDMSAQKEADEKIRKLSHAVEQSPVSIIITDHDGYIEYVNPVFCEFTGFQSEEVLGKNPRFQKSDLLPKGQYVELWEAISQGNIWRGELVNRKKSGEIYFELATISPIVNSKGEITHFVCVKQDITEKKRFEQELLDSREKAKESDLLKAAFLQNMSHEIRTPMNGILGFSELARSKNLKPEKRDEYLSIVITSTHRLLGIVEDIMDVSRLETGDIALKNRSVKLSALMEKFYYSYLKKIEGDVELQKPVIGSKLQNNIVLVDSERLTQVMDKLLSNAVKFTPTGKIKFGCYQQDKGIRFFVEDTGIGINPDMTDLIFQPFYQIDMGQTRSFGGNGLGLTIASRIIDKMGSTIQVNSNPQKGSCFFFDLVFEKKDTNVESPAQHVIPNKKKHTILVAEADDVSFILFREILSRQFDEDKFELLRASSSNQAIELCRKRDSIDLVFVDVRMHYFDGISMAHQVKTIIPGVPIIGQYECTSGQMKDDFLNAGCDDYISKPFRQSLLIEKVNKFLSISG
ncbi:hybrid sensor histidine kinase/response regulator [Marinilabilia rubra]|uniref:histidine kinase n=1 Tax=Marinilabilia rubra TaxID=2162893 RepID=A0A2U2BC80_9BACT|nr:PAS domain S-box protein [Marinilabilia rubra]PWE00676.1 hypothetical protein DDZ16_03525 [Marinilabilia rubra]